MEKKRVLVIGAGIGGLVLARALEKAGFEASVFERAPSFAPVGAGLLVQAGAMLALRRLGLDGAVLAGGSEVTLGLGLASTGKVLQATPMGFLNDEVGARVVAIHRAKLHEIFAGALEGSRISLGKQCVGFDDDDTGVTARFADGSS